MRINEIINIETIVGFFMELIYFSCDFSINYVVNYF